MTKQSNEQPGEYWDCEDIEAVTRCPVCDASNSEPVYTALLDQEEGVPGLWSMRRCGTCASFFLDPRPTAAAIFKAYRSYYTHRTPEDENAVLSASGFFPSLLQRYLRGRFGLSGRPGPTWVKAAVALCPPLSQQLAYFMRHLPSVPGRLLDVGCGNGAFMVRARLAGWYVEGIETDEVAARVARRHAQCPVHADFDLVQPGSYDQVTLSHVVEHLHQPNAILLQCFKALKAGGRIWIATPNITGLGHRIFGRSWQPLETPRHLAMPSPSGLADMLLRAGFVNVRFHRRGRGSKKRIAASLKRSGAVSQAGTKHFLMTLFVDAASSFSRWAGEELVVTAEVPVS